MSMPTGSNPTIQEIIKAISDGEYRIPRFQRDFVWDIKKSAALLDSIFKGFPISSVILWKTKNELSEIRNLGGIEIPGRDTGRYTSYIIDGQQRLTSLYFALKGLKTGTGSDFSEMCISLVAEWPEQLVFDKLPKDANPDDYVVLKDLFSATALAGSHPEKRLEYFQVLLQYKISVIEIDDENLGLEEVIEIFERLNLGGKKLNLFSIIAARSYQTADDGGNSFDLSKKYDAFNQVLKNSNYGRIGDSIFLQCISACLIGKVNKSDILRNLSSDLIFSEYDNVEKAIFAAIEHLKGQNYGVLVANLLPYERMLVPFTYFHYHMKSKAITTQQEQYLRDFFWRCILGKRYNSSADTNTNADIGKIKKIIDGEVPVQEPITLSPKAIVENGRFMLSSAYVKGMLCLMAQNKPQSFGVGRTINITNDAVSSSAKRQYHHFFPTKSAAIKENTSYAAMVNNVVNIVFMDAVTNDQISNRNPSDYVGQFNGENPDFAAALDSHYIEVNGYGLENDEFHIFLNARSRAMYNKLCGYILPCKQDMILDASAII